MPHPGRIEGLVRDSNGKAEASVVVLRQYTLGQHTQSVKADAAGRFTAIGLPLGRYFLTIRGDLAGDVELVPNRPTARVTLEALPWDSLRGVVRDNATGKPVAGAIVMANLPSRNQQSWSRFIEMGHRFEWSQFTARQLGELAKVHNKPFTFTDSEGRYELKVGNETGPIFAAGPNFDLFPQEFELFERVRGNKDVDFALTKRSLHRVHGRVTFEDGKPYAARAIRVIMRRHPEHFTDVDTDHAGRYSFDSVHELWGGLEMAVAGYSIMHQRVPFNAEPPFPAVDWVLKPSQKGTLKVTIARADGKPLPDDAEFIGFGEREPADAANPGEPAISYREADWGTSSLHLKLTGGKGELSLAAGPYAFSLHPVPLTDAPKSQRLDINQYFGTPAPGPDATRFSIAPGKVTELKLVAQPSALTIVVKDEAGVPAPGVNIGASLWHEDRAQYSGTSSVGASNDQGELLFDPLKPGLYVFYPATGGGNYTSLQRYVVTLKEGQHERLTLVVSKEDLKAQREYNRVRYVAKVRGQIFMPDGVTPAAGAAIYAHRDEAALDNPQTFAAADGTFVLTNQRTGPLTIQARGHGTALAIKTLEIDEDELPPVRIELKKAAIIRGRILNTDGTPANDVRLWLGRPDIKEPFFWGMPRGEGSHLVTTPVRQGGTFALHGVAPGKQRLCVYRDGILQIHAVYEFDITEGEVRQDVQLTIAPGRPFEVHFERADGLPMPRRYSAQLHTDFGSLDMQFGLNPHSCSTGDENHTIARSPAPLSPGRYRLCLDTSGWWTKSEFQTLPSLLVHDIDVQPGDDGQRFDVTVPTAGAIKGRVLLHNGAPAAAMRVAVHPDGQAAADDAPNAPQRELIAVPPHATVPIDPDGNYTMFGLVPGRYRLSIRWGYRSQEQFISDALEVENGRVTSAGVWTIGR